MSSGISRKGGKKNRKWKRNLVKCARYSSEHRYEKNKVRNLRKHLKMHVSDAQANKAFAGLAMWH